MDTENNVILVKGNIPGPKKGLVIIKTAVKNPGKVNEMEKLHTYKVEEPKEETPETVAENTEETQESVEE